MAQTFSIPLQGDTQGPAHFPSRCVCCGAPQQAESTLSLNRLVLRGQRQVQVAVKYQIPHCERCARSTKAVFLAGCIPFVVGLLLVGGVLFVAAFLGASALGLDEGVQTTTVPSLVLGAAGGLFGGFIGGLLFEVVARVLLLPFFGQALLRAPLLAAQFFSNSDYVAGVTATFTRDARHVQLTFANGAIANEFAALNGGLVAPTG
ncbi:MAG: hypothetical protein MUD01_01790 [Chloroflexaceae bacterium]|nr:hypothetical protein [Chloroflexaceae bacterium]